MCTSYDVKKANCKKRMIEFNFTEEEYDIFCKLQESVKCAYTNREFVFVEQHKYSPTLERIDQDKGYSPDNCVWVTLFANTVKERFIESNKLEVEANIEEARAITRIKRILASEENLTQIKEPYVKALQAIVKPSHNKEITLAKGYSVLGNYWEKEGLAFNLTFAQYKYLNNRKFCDLTGRNLANESKNVYVFDKTQPVTKENTCITSKKLRESLDSFTRDNALTKEELKKMFTMLIK